MLVNGDGIKQDLKEAIRLLKITVANDNYTSTNYLGDLYYNGIGVPSDKKEAARLYKIYNSACMLRDGDGIINYLFNLISITTMCRCYAIIALSVELVIRDADSFL